MDISKIWPLVKEKKIYMLILIAIFIASLFLNFFHLGKRSLLDWDEAYYLEVIKTWRAGINWFTYKVFNPVEIRQFTFNDYVLKHGGAINTFAKDGFLAIVFLFSYFVGLRDVTVLWINSVFGILTLWMVYLIGKETLNRVAGLLSCAVLAVSIYHLHYSRSGFPQTASVFFLYLAVLLYIFSYKRRNEAITARNFLFFSGVSLGYGFTCHYNLFWALPIFYIMETASGIFFSSKISLRDFRKRLFPLLLGQSFPILFLGFSSELIKLILKRNPASVEAMYGSLGAGTFVSYFDRIRDFLGPFLSKASLNSNLVYIKSQADPIFYLRLLLLWEGPLILILLLMGIAYMVYRQIRQRIFLEFIILPFFLIPFFYWSFHSWQLSRSFLAAIPAMALIIGSLLAQGVNKIYKTEITMVTIIFIILSFFLFQAHKRIKQELSYASGYPIAIKFMKEQAGLRHLSSQYTISRFFVGRENALDISVSFTGTNIKYKLRKLYDESNYRYLLLDQMRIIFADSPIVQAAKISTPVLILPHSTDANLFENNVAGFVETVQSAPKTLEIYELSEIINNLK